MCMYATSGPTLGAILVVNKWLSDGVAQEVLLASLLRAPSRFLRWWWEDPVEAAELVPGLCNVVSAHDHAPLIQSMRL